MPRTNQPRTVNAERRLAGRIAQERELRGWSYETLARRMADVGCPIQPTAIHKIEKANPPRRIVVDELVGFAAAFGIGAESLLEDPLSASAARVYRALVDYDDAAATVRGALAVLVEADRNVGEVSAETRPDALRQGVEAFVESLAPAARGDFDFNSEVEAWLAFASDPDAPSRYALPRANELWAARGGVKAKQGGAVSPKGAQQHGVRPKSGMGDAIRLKGSPYEVVERE